MSNSTLGQSEPKRLNVGTLIQVKPTLQNQGQQIILEVEYECKNFLGFENDLPQTEEVTANTRVCIPNGSTVLLGGQKLTEEKDGRKVQKTLICLVKAEKVEAENTDRIGSL